MIGWGFVLAALAVACVPAAMAKPYLPQDDALVLERLPEKGDPALARLKRMRAALRANPRDLAMALPLARQALEAARERGDPRFLGQAQAALAPWWTDEKAPPAARLLRATVKQSQHDFAGSLADLDRLLAAHPAPAQARLTRATVLTVLGRYREALHDCAALRPGTSALVVAACEAAPASLSGSAGPAYDALLRALRQAPADPGVREWALTLAAEIAARRGDAPAAEAHFREALLLDPRDPYLKAAYADFLLDRDRPRDVPPLVGADTRNDSLLLRLALAEQRLADRRDAFAAHRADLTARFAAARRRGDRLHLREEARFSLTIAGDAAAALALARENWSVQREPADLRILVDAARAAGDGKALAVARDWMLANRFEGFVTDASPSWKR